MHSSRVGELKVNPNPKPIPIPIPNPNLNPSPNLHHALEPRGRLERGARGVGVPKLGFGFG